MDPLLLLKWMDAFCGRNGGQNAWIIFGIVLILWLLGLTTGYTMGGVIPILLVITIAVALIRVIQRRRPVAILNCKPAE